MSMRDSGRGRAGTGNRESDASGPRAHRDDRPPVSQVGRYLLLKQLGQGGMGVVYAAYDPDLDRKVALKLLHADRRTDTEEARARLLREAQAMARVSHPNVIPIFDVDVWGDRVFLAMELVDGGTLGSWVKQGQRSWREVLETFLAAGRGLQAAHEAGLVHRDFKPANVLVGRTGRVFVTDFGLARPVGALPREEPPAGDEPSLPSERRMLETPLTEAGRIIGTPSYMSPEQFRGDELDPRSDQFSFCVALYWALYRQRPFEPEKMEAHASSLKPRAPAGAEFTEPLRVTAPLVREAPKAPPPPALIQEPPRDVKVPAWVRQAVMRGLSLDPAERFASMTELLGALSQEHRVARRRRWLSAAGATAVGVALVGGVLYQQSRVCAAAGARMDEAWSPQARQRVEAAFLATGKPYAQELADKASQVLDGYAAAWKRQSTEACEATHVQGVQTEELLTRRTGCLARRQKDVRATVELLASADAALVEKSLDAVHALPSLHECEDEESLAEQQRLPTDAAKRADIERLEERLAGVKALVDAGRYPLALTAVRELEAAVLATGHLPLIAELRFHLGWLQEQNGQSPEAAKLLFSAMRDAEAGRADRLKVAILNKLLYVEDGQQHFEPAAGWGELALATLQRLGGEPVLEADVRVNQSNLALSQQRYEDARALLEQARALQAQALPPGHPKRARTTFMLGGALLDSGEPQKAVALLEEALAQTEASVGPWHPDMAQRHGMLSLTLRELKQDAKALEHASAAARIRKATRGDTSVAYAEALDEVGMCLHALGRYDEALKAYEEALAIKQRALPADDERLQYSHDGVGQALLGLGRARESVESLRQAVSFASAPPDVLAESGFALARALWQLRQPPEARGQAVQARERFSEAGLKERAADVDAWLATLPPEPPPRPARKPARKARR
ncbi:protein kinase domain-containing protein [Pyxidicoccus xibeiensis]|uniref:protein kinase domain-containing protein n=1 Tax=Pyxidicoccus xibeiensis TaxID=2906759 RepID=UPI0020A70CCF|nr:tetratricopeptide repeat protein [Pyxidicoccus xibeiensis]MCP3138329.1 serine/threonine-protein kinase [Pyxidicoccus xibeiensis]